MLCCKYKNKIGKNTRKWLSLLQCPILMIDQPVWGGINPTKHHKNTWSPKFPEIQMKISTRSWKSEAKVNQGIENKQHSENEKKPTKWRNSWTKIKQKIVQLLYGCEILRYCRKIHSLKQKISGGDIFQVRLKIKNHTCFIDDPGNQFQLFILDSCGQSTRKISAWKFQKKTSLSYKLLHFNADAYAVYGDHQLSSSGWKESLLSLTISWGFVLVVFSCG